MRAFAWTACIGLAACRPAPTSEPRIYPEKEAPPELAAQVERADAALLVLRTKLLETLTTELSRGGPAGAVDVCRDVAQEITASAAQEQGVALGRTSHRLRNPANAPRNWAREIVDAHDGKKAAEAQSYVADLGDRVGVLRPIGAIEICGSCHGGEEALDPLAWEKIAAGYPQDQAVGFGVGELRGWMWAEAPK
jgi:hypothetical protein